MIIKGVIDGVQRSSGRFSISGWAYVAHGDKIHPVEAIDLEGATSIEFNFMPRLDIEPDRTDNKLGFIVVLDKLETLAGLLYGFVHCYARHSSGVRSKLELWQGIQTRILSILIQEKLDEATAKAIASPLLEKLKAPSAAEPRESVKHCLELGLRSYDGATVVGKHGHLFLYQGSNSLDQIYRSKLDERVAERWCRLIEERANFVEQLGSRFLQMIVPEKQSVMPEYYPDEIITPTPLLRAIRNNFKQKQNHYFPDLLAIMRRSFVAEGLEVFRKVDTHPAFHGTVCLVRELITAAGGDLSMIEMPHLKRLTLKGDLGHRFGIGDIVADTLYPSLEHWSFAQNNPRLVDSIDPLGNAQIGAFREWESDFPLIDKSVMIFGNSVFARGGEPLGLSWWAARLFRRTVFYWSPAMDYQAVVERKPDLVVAQTVERFLPTVPSA